MPETMTETPGERTMRQWYQGKLGERLLQAGQMAKDRKMLRRGVRMQQDGTLGQQAGSPAEEDGMNIRVGDEVHNHYGAEPQQVAAPVDAKKSLLAKVAPLLVAGAIGAAGAGVGIGLPLAAWAWLGGAAADAVVDTDTQYILELVPDDE